MLATTVPLTLFPLTKVEIMSKKQWRTTFIALSYPAWNCLWRVVPRQVGCSKRAVASWTQQDGHSKLSHSGEQWFSLRPSSAGQQQADEEEGKDIGWDSQTKWPALQVKCSPGLVWRLAGQRFSRCSTSGYLSSWREAKVKSSNQAWLLLVSCHAHPVFLVIIWKHVALTFFLNRFVCFTFQFDL